MEKRIESTMELLQNQNLHPKLSATDQVIQAIKNLLLNRQLRSGDRLPNETEIASSVGVSRGSVREAMKILSAMGVVDIRRGDGTYITDTVQRSMIDKLMLSIVMTETDAYELAEIRQIIEIGIVRLCVAHATASQIETLRKAVRAQEKAVAEGAFDYDRLMKTEWDFHNAMVDAANNQLLTTMYTYILELYMPTRDRELDYEEHMREALRVHPPVVEAIAARDADAGEAAIRETTKQWTRLLGDK